MTSDNLVKEVEMRSYTHILAPTDFSETGTQAVYDAAQLAREFKVNLHMLHIVAPQAFYSEMPEVVMPPLADITEKLISAGRQQMQSLAAAIGKNVQVSIHLEESAERPAHAICSFADTLPADLIVIGSHGHTGLMHMLLGSTAEQVVREAKCPVLVTKPKRAEN